MAMKLCGAILLLSSLVGCAVKTPELLPDSLLAFKAPVTTDVESEQLGASWWRELGLPELDDLVDLALKDNFTVQAAELRLKEAHALDNASIWSLLPKASSELVEGTSRTDRYSVDGEPWVQAPGAPMTNSRGSLSASWEVPLFGKLSATRALNKGQVDYAYWSAVSTKATVTQEVVSAYVEALGTQAMASTLRDSRSALEQQVRAEEFLRDKGVSTQTEVDRLKEQASDIDGQLEDVHARLTVLRAKLGVLVGNPQAGVLDTLMPWRATPEQAAEQFSTAIQYAAEHIEVRAEAIRMRPDVRMAEAKVTQAVAQAGIARANLFPQLTLEGALNITKGGLDSTGLTEGFSAMHSADMSLRIPLLDWPALKAESNARNMELQAVVWDYRATVLSAWSDVTESAANARANVHKVQVAREQQLRVKAAVSLERIAFQRRYVTSQDYCRVQAAYSSAVAAALRSAMDLLTAWAKMKKSVYAA